MNPNDTRSCTAFANTDRIASGEPRDVAAACHRLVATGDARIVLVFDDETAYPVELDLRGSAEDVRARYATQNGPVAESVVADAPSAPRGPGRPKLGVVGREVTLLPRHWEWLNAQPGGASVALRKLVERARRENEAADRVRRAQESTLRFMSAMAGNEAGYEEASRALYAGDAEKFEVVTESWPRDVRDFARTLASGAFEQPAQQEG